jgi:chromosome segregation ATPase
VRWVFPDNTKEAARRCAAAVAEPALAPERLRKLANGLRVLLDQAETEMEQLGREFQELARETGTLLETAGVIVGCAESERMGSVLPGVQTLGAAARDFIRERLGATAGVLDTVVAEEKLLEHLTQLTRGQKAIVRETGMLRVLTNIEVARLGDVGAGFQYLAHELDDFSQSVARSTTEMLEHTDGRGKAIGETRRTLAAELPEMREEFARIEQSLDKALVEVDGALAELRQTPLRFRTCVEEVAERIAGVVAAIQAHDITRQQIEHVETSLAMIADAMVEAGERGDADACTALTIQSYQLRNVRQTVDGWMTQIRTCLEGIAHIASSEILDLGPVVMRQESALSAQLSRIERLEEACEASDARVQASFAGITGLMQLVSEHLRRSKSVRDRLQLLMFNSIVEASHLGAQADGILEISTTIKRISAAWGEITARSEAVTGQIRTLVDESHATVEAFSESSYANLREKRAATRTGLEALREAAECADARGLAVEAAVRGLQARITEIGAAGERLESGFRRLEAVLDEIETLRRQLENAEGEIRDTHAVEQQFSAHYTTEMERVVLRAALSGGPLPAAQQSFAGNSVELF